MEKYLDPGHCCVVVHEKAGLEAKHWITEDKDNDILLRLVDIKTQRKKNGKEKFHNFFQKTKEDRKGRYFEGL